MDELERRVDLADGNGCIEFFKNTVVFYFNEESFMLDYGELWALIKKVAKK